MGHVAKSDGRVSQEEIKAARFIMQRMGLNEQQRQLAVQMFNQGKQFGFDLDAAPQPRYHAKIIMHYYKCLLRFNINLPQHHSVKVRKKSKFYNISVKD